MVKSRVKKESWEGLEQLNEHEYGQLNRRASLLEQKEAGTESIYKTV